MGFIEFSHIFGGLGLFLFGVSTLTEGIKELTGRGFTRLVKTVAHNKFTGILAGTFFTVMVQSSTATIFICMGFLSAKIITLAQAITLMFGANLGTTVSTWLVNLLSVNISMSTVALPFVGLGSLLKLSRSNFKKMGTPILGFGLFFMGLGFIKSGFSEYSEFFSQLSVSTAGVGGRGLLVLIGILLTAILQSSIAFLAVVITATVTGTLGLDAGISLVIGSNIGITLIVYIGSLSSNYAARRLAIGNILFNLIIGLVCFVFFHPFRDAVIYFSQLIKLTDTSSILTVYHTLYNFLGILLLSPFLKPLENALQKLFIEQERKNRLDKYLDVNLLKTPSAALEAAERELKHIASMVYNLIKNGLQPPKKGQDIFTLVSRVKSKRKNIEKLTGKYVEYIDAIKQDDFNESIRNHFMVLITTSDNLKMAAGYLNQAVKFRPYTTISKGEIHKARLHFEKLVLRLAKISSTKINPSSDDEINAIREEAREMRHNIRTQLFKLTAQGKYEYQDGINLADYISHLDRVISHLCRINRISKSPLIWGDTNDKIDADNSP